MTTDPRRPHGTGSVYQECTKTCPPRVRVTDDDGTTRMARPEHDCPGRWVGSYVAGWSKKGTRRRPKVIGRTKREAQNKLKAALRSQADSEAASVGGKPTVKRWADTWLEGRKSHARPTTWATDRSQVRNWIVPAIGHRRLEQIGPADIRAVHHSMHVGGAQASSILRAHRVLHQILKDAILAGHKVPQGALLVEGPALGEPDRDAIPLGDAILILQAASKLPNASRWVAAMLQGMRPAECLGLTWSQVDLDSVDPTITVEWQLKPLPYLVPHDRESGFRVPIGFEARQLAGALHLVRPKTKAGKRVIPLVPAAVAALREWRGVAPESPHDLVWPRVDGSPQREKADREEWRALTEAAGVWKDGEEGKGHDLYACRHTAATLLRRARVDDETITAILGHASILSTKDYLHTDPTRTRAALEQMATTLGLDAG